MKTQEELQQLGLDKLTLAQFTGTGAYYRISRKHVLTDGTLTVHKCKTLSFDDCVYSVGYLVYSGADVRVLLELRQVDNLPLAYKPTIVLVANSNSELSHQCVALNTPAEECTPT